MNDISTPLSTKERIKARMLKEELKIYFPLYITHSQAFLYNFFSALLLTISFILVKLLNNIEEEYSINLFESIRFFTIGLLGYLHMINNRVEYLDIFDLEYKNWILMRIMCSLFGFTFFIISTMYIRLGSAIIIYSTFPFWSCLICIILLKERITLQYYLGSVIILIGSFILTINESNNITDNDLIINNKTKAVVLGTVCSIFNALLTALLHISTRILSSKYNDYCINYLVGKYASLIAIVLSICNLHSLIISMFDYKFFGIGLLNGVVSFYGFYFLSLSFRRMDLSKSSILGYIQLVTVYSISHFWFDEDIYFLDIVGITIIILFGIITSV